MPIHSIQFFAPANPVCSDTGKWIHQLFPEFKLVSASDPQNWNGLHGTDLMRARELDFLKLPAPGTLYMGGRGGYGSMRALNRWLEEGNFPVSGGVMCGFSDLTVFLNFLPQFGFSCWHGPLGTVPKALALSQGNLAKSFRALVENSQFQTPIHSSHALKGQVIGGNLTVFLSLLGTRFEPDWKGKILLLEDIAESTYRLDRMFTQILSHKEFKNLAGVLLGQFTDCTPQKGSGFNVSLADVCADFVSKSSVPVVQDIAVGHIEDMLTIPMDRDVTVLDGSIFWDAIPEKS